MIKLGRVIHGSLPSTLDLVAPYHLAIQGATRSGKSMTLYRILGSLASQENVWVAGCDPSSILLSPWASHPGQELRSLGMGDVDGHVRVIEKLVAEMDKRISALIDVERGVFQDKLEVFTPDLPLIVVVLEEYPGLVAGLDTLKKDRANVFRLGVRRLIQEGAKVGFRVVLVAQRFDASIIGGAERSNLAVRITHRVDNADAVRMLHSDASPELVSTVKELAPGHAYVDSPGMPGKFIQVFYTPYREYARRVWGAGEREALD